MSDLRIVLEVQILALLGWVDGRFEQEEHEASREILKGSMDEAQLVAELKKMGQELPKTAQVLVAVSQAPREIARAAIKSGFALAKADGYLHVREFSILYQLAEAAGIPEVDLMRVGSIDNLHQAFNELEKLF